MECPKTPEARGLVLTSSPLRGPLAPPFRVADETQIPAPVNDTAGNQMQAPVGEPTKEAGNPEPPSGTPSVAAGNGATNDPTPDARASADAATQRGAEETRGAPTRADAGTRNEGETPSRRKGNSKPNKVSLESHGHRKSLPKRKRRNLVPNWVGRAQQSKWFL